MFHAAHNLPPLRPDEQAHSERLLVIIHEELAQHDNWLSFERYMELSLYAPGLGYYSAGSHKLGEGGDFTTAPEISSLFSGCIANQCAEVLQRVHGGHVLELGAGSGIMAVDMLLRLEKLGRLPDQYCILEVSADLQQRQQALLQQKVPHLFHKLRWLQSLPAQFNGFIVANEVLDALPVKRFCMMNEVIHELGVGVVESQLAWQARPADACLQQTVAALMTEIGHTFDNGYCSEINLLLPRWISSLSETLQRGVLLFVDYGLPRKQYYSIDRTQGTLNCFFRHHQHDNPFLNVGMQDITAWVDFTLLAQSGVDAGLELNGFATQAHWLMGAGIASLLHDAMNDSELTDIQRWRLSQQAQQLMLPDGMGETFKAMSFSKDVDIEPGGFSVRDLRDSL